MQIDELPSEHFSTSFLLSARLTVYEARQRSDVTRLNLENTDLVKQEMIDGLNRRIQDDQARRPGAVNKEEMRDNNARLLLEHDIRTLKDSKENLTSRIEA
jgi:hypothetical protein